MPTRPAAATREKASTEELVFKRLRAIGKAQDALADMLETSLSEIGRTLEILQDEVGKLGEAVKAQRLEYAAVREDNGALTNEVRALVSRFTVSPGRDTEHNSGALRSRMPNLAEAHSRPVDANARADAGQQRRR